MMAFLILAGVMVALVAWFTATANRAIARNFDQRGRSIDQDMVEARLYRIEEAIDAMALQIERLTEQQQVLLPPPAPSHAPAPPSERRE